MNLINRSINERLDSIVAEAQRNGELAIPIGAVLISRDRQGNIRVSYKVTLYIPAE